MDGDGKVKLPSVKTKVERVGYQDLGNHKSVPSTIKLIKRTNRIANVLCKESPW